jgi:prophage DNA circulation protein
MAIFEQLALARWEPDGNSELAIRFAVVSISEDGANRIVERERPYRDGAKLDDTGSKAKRWSVETCWENSLQPGTSSVADAGGLGEPQLSNNPEPLYPNMLNLMIASFEIHETGVLTLPTRGQIRCRAEKYSRTESAELRDAAMVSFEFVEDNEDNVNAAAFAKPSVNANARALAETTTFTAQSLGAWGGSLQDLNEFAAGLEGIANFPGDTLADVDQQAGIVVGASNRVQQAFSQPNDGRDQLNDPESSVLQRKLEHQQDIAAEARANARRGRPNLVAIAFEGPRSIFQVANEFGQDVADLINVNPQIEDVLFIPAGVVVNIFDLL